MKSANFPIVLLFVSLFVSLFGGASFLDEQTATADWLTLPSRYTHDDISGQRVSQYAPVELPVAANTPPLRTSGYTHYRSTLAYGQSADNYHRVEEWGDPVRPYGEWRFPFRPYSTPYPNWGPPYAGLNLYNGFGFGFGGGVVPGQGPALGQPGMGQPGMGQPGIGNGVGPGGAFGNPNQRPYRPNPGAGANGFAPYPSGRGTPYPVAPYYDGYYPNYRD
ncbi:hypothetical protein [Neorhodopirellula pilleata]|nr:hypothetical protein [Neorhodopirellula pilleata]